MLNNNKLRVEIIQLYHNQLIAEYREKIMKLMTRNYQWPEIIRDIGKYVNGYNMCQRMKHKTEAPIKKLKLSKIPEKPWTYLIIDFITKLPLVARKNAILVVCNKLSKMMHFVTTIEKTIAEGLVRLFRDNMWKLHRLLESMVLDRELQFTAELTKKLNKMLEIEMKLSTSFYLQTDSQMERMNQVLEQYL